MSLTYTEQLTVVTCFCGIHFAIPESRYRWMKRSSKNECHCPNGHTMHFTESAEKEIKRLKEEARATKDLLRAEERSHAATRGHLTKAKKQVHRAEHGVCPHCNRSFQNLQRHVASKHPECLA